MNWCISLNWWLIVIPICINTYLNSHKACGARRFFITVDLLKTLLCCHSISKWIQNKLPHFFFFFSCMMLIKTICNQLAIGTIFKGEFGFCRLTRNGSLLLCFRMFQLEIGVYSSSHVQSGTSNTGGWIRTYSFQINIRTYDNSRTRIDAWCAL